MRAPRRLEPFRTADNSAFCRLGYYLLCLGHGFVPSSLYAMFVIFFETTQSSTKVLDTGKSPGEIGLSPTEF